MGIVRKKAGGVWGALRPSDDLWVKATSTAWAYPLAVFRKDYLTWRVISLGHMQTTLPVPPLRYVALDSKAYDGVTYALARISVGRLDGSVGKKIYKTWSPDEYLWKDQTGDGVYNPHMSSGSMRLRVTNVTGDYFWGGFDTNIPDEDTWYSFADLSLSPYWEIYLSGSAKADRAAYFDVEIQEADHPENAITFSATVRSRLT